MVGVKTIEGAFTPTFSQRNDGKVNVYWTIPYSEIHSFQLDESVPKYIWQLAEQGLVKELPEGGRKYRILPIVDYGGLIKALQRSAESMEYIPDLVVVSEDFKMLSSGNQPKRTIPQLCDRVISHLDRIRDDLEDYLRKLFRYMQEQTEEIDYLLEKVNPNAISIMCASGLHFLEHNGINPRN